MTLRPLLRGRTGPRTPRNRRICAVGVQLQKQEQDPAPGERRDGAPEPEGKDYREQSAGLQVYGQRDDRARRVPHCQQARRKLSGIRVVSAARQCHGPQSNRSLLITPGNPEGAWHVDDYNAIPINKTLTYRGFFANQSRANSCEIINRLRVGTACNQIHA